MLSELKPLHEKNSIAFHRSGIYAALFLSSSALAIVAWETGYWPVTVLLWVVIAHLGHVNLFVLHESSHYLLHPNRLLNEAQGILVGTFSLVPLSAYRLVHGRHHTHLSQEEDVEFWPYTDPSTSLAFRRIAVLLETVLGAIWTPMVFLRGVFQMPKIALAVKWRLAAEYAGALLFWGLVIGTAAYFGQLDWFVVGYAIPTLLTGSMQTVRKFIEHMGLYGDTVDTATRTIDDRSILGRLVSFSMLNGDIHGPHHLQAKIPQSHLPSALDVLRREGYLTEASIYPNYWSAIKAMLKELRNPRIGKQWLYVDDRPSARTQDRRPIAV